MAPNLCPLVSALLPLTLIACGVTHSFDQTSDRLAVCAVAPGGGAEYPLVSTEAQTYAVLEPLELHVVASGCGAACVDDLVQSCEVSVEAQVLRVQASFSWSERRGECVLICAPIKAVSAVGRSVHGGARHAHDDAHRRRGGAGGGVLGGGGGMSGPDRGMIQPSATGRWADGTIPAPTG